MQGKNSECYATNFLQIAQSLSVYRCPVGDSEYLEKKLDEVLNDLETEFIVCGDFSVDSFSQSTHKLQLTSLLNTSDLTSTVNFPTTVPNNS
jgi:hypothetical protein